MYYKMNVYKNDQKFQWIGKGIPFQRRGSKIRHTAFSIGGLKINVGDFVLVRNEDALDPEDVMTSYVAQVKDLFDTGEEYDPYQAQVQWFSKVLELPSYAIKSLKDIGDKYEVVQDRRSTWHDMIDAETIFQKCEILFLDPDGDYESIISKYMDHPFPVFYCRYVFTGKSLKSVMTDKCQQIINNTLNSIVANDECTYMNGFIPHADEKEHSSVTPQENCKSTDMNGLIHHTGKTEQNNMKTKKNKSSKKADSNYYVIPIGDSEFPKVVIKKIDDRILESKSRGVRVLVADSNVDNITESFVKKLKLAKEEKSNNSLEKRPIIHTFTSQVEVPEDFTQEKNFCLNRNSTFESKTAKTSKSKKSYICEENETSLNNKLHKSVSDRTTRNSSRKSGVLNNIIECTTPQKKAKLDDVCVRRSGRKVKPINYSEQESGTWYEKKVTFSTTPRKKKMPHFVHNSCSDESDTSNFNASEGSSSDDSSLSDVSSLEESKSESSRKTKQLAKKKSSKRVSSSTTQKSSRKNVKSLCIPERKTPLKTPQNPLEESRQRLHVSAVPDSLPCREEEYSDIYSFVKGCLFAKTGGCMYISGVPGTGKTATVHEVIRNLEEEKESGEIPIFSFVEVNGMWMTDPYQCYVQIFKALTGKCIAPQQASDLLEKRFTEPGPKKDAVVLLVDELDRLWTRKQTVMYNIFDWPTKKNSKLIVLAIANTMDLPERMMMNRISSRLGLTRRTFQPYTFKQLQEIILSRIQELKVFDPDAVQLVSRKVAAVSGDARRALDICRFAAEIVKVESFPKKSRKVLIGMEHVDVALQQMFSSPIISAIRSSSKTAKLFFQCMLSEFNRTGLEETTLQKVHQQVVAVCRFEGLRPPNSSEISRVCIDLAASHLILVDNFKNDLYMKIRLNVSPDDVTYALTKH